MNRVFEMAFLVSALPAVLLVACSTPDVPGKGANPSSEKAEPRVVRQLERPANTKRLDARDLVGQLASAGLSAEDLGPAQISMDDVSRFPEESRSSMRLRISDGQGNSSPMTFVEFGSWKAAAKLDTKPVMGFAVRNWFVLGSVNNYFVELVTEALAG